MLITHVSKEGGGGGQQASCLVAKQAVEFPQVLASKIILPKHFTFILNGLLFLVSLIPGTFPKYYYCHHNSSQQQ